MPTDAMIEAGLEAWDLWRAATPSERMRAALVAAERAAWRPIEEAPRDGSAILGWNSEYGARETRSETYRPGSPGYAQGLTDRWWTWDEPVSNWAHRWKPTHFRPLPTPGEPDER